MKSSRLVVICASLIHVLSSTRSTKTNDDIVLELSHDITSRLSTSVDLTESDPILSASPRMRSSSPSQLQVNKKMKSDYSGLRGVGSQPTLLVTLDQEIQRFDRLLDLVHTSLDLLCLAVKGQIIMTKALEDTFNSLLNNVVPAQWKVRCAILIY